MANVGQAMFVGPDVTIHCDSEWDCCQREQAKAKVEAYEAEIKNPESPGPLQIAPPGGVNELQQTKANAQARAWTKFRKRMGDASPDERKEVARELSTSDCLGDELAEKWEEGSRSSKELGVQMDHQIEAKVGGPADIDVLPALDTKINNFFGVNFAKNTGDRMTKSGVAEIASVKLVCPGDENCGDDYST